MFQLIKYQNKNPNVIAIFFEVHILRKYVESNVFIPLMFVPKFNWVSSVVAYAYLK